MLEEELGGAEREISMMENIQYDMTQQWANQEQKVFGKQIQILYKLQNDFSEDVGQEI